LVAVSGPQLQVLLLVLKLNPLTSLNPPAHPLAKLL
jgi:hypothetical protein